MASNENAKGCGCLLVIALVIGGVAYLVGTQSRAWKEATTINTPEAYRKYVSEHPSGWYKKEAETKIKVLKDLAWEAAVKEPTPEKLNAYLEHFPDGEHRQEAEAKLRPLHDDAAWEALEKKANPTPLDYDNFLKNFPNSPYARELREKAQEGVWHYLESSKADAASYAAYAKNYPNSAHVTEATQKMYELAWRELEKGVKTPEAYKKYAAKYPASPYAAKADELSSGDKERTGDYTSNREIKKKVENVRETAAVPEKISTYESVYERRPRKKSARATH
jgi:hypothetical protein